MPSKNTLSTLAVGFIAVLIAAGLAYGGFHLQRWFHWEFAYGDNVKQTVCDMVKPEHLKNPEDCK